MANINEDYSVLYQNGFQMKTFINENMGMVDDAVIEYNDTLAHLVN